jgi:hypothetical protein
MWASLISKDKSQAFELSKGSLAPQEMKEVLTKLRGMLVEEQNDVIDALVGQKGF